MLCRNCGQVDHAGGCDLVEFYHFQRWAAPLKREPTPAPPGPAMIDPMPGDDEAPSTLCTNQNLDEFGNVSFTPLSETVTNEPVKPPKVKRPKQGKIMTTGKAKPVDAPELVAKREAIKAARIARMEYVRSYRKKNVATKNR